MMLLCWVVLATLVYFEKCAVESPSVMQEDLNLRLPLYASILNRTRRCIPDGTRGSLLQPTGRRLTEPKGVNVTVADQHEPCNPSPRSGISEVHGQANGGLPKRTRLCP
jgi:hypothetical protein